MLQGNVSVSEAETETYRIRNGMPTEDRGSHKKRRVKKRRNIQQTGYQIRNNRQNTILWTSELDEERTIPQNSTQRLRTWNQKEGKTKETMDRHDKRALRRTAYDTSRGHMLDERQESVASNHRRTADTCNDIAWAMKEEEKERQIRGTLYQRSRRALRKYPVASISTLMETNDPTSRPCKSRAYWETQYNLHLLRAFEKTVL